MKILQVSTEDIGGDAENIVWTLHEGYQAREQTAWVAVGRKKSDCSDRLLISNYKYRHSWTRYCYTIANFLKCR